MSAITHQGINREHPLLAGTLPDSARVQIIMPPATRGDIAIAIRKHIIADIQLSDYARSEAFSASIIAEYVRSTIDVFVQLGREKRRRVITNITMSDRIMGA